MYNDNALKLLRDNGYDKIEIQGHTFILGAAELDGEYSQFKTMGSKRYLVRKKDGELKLTVAGVPKKTGVKCLKNSFDNFKTGFVFRGDQTGKKEHTYITVPEIYIDEWGNETGDSINLSPADYTLDSTDSFDWYFNEILGTSFSVEIPCHDEGGLYNV